MIRVFLALALMTLPAYAAEPVPPEKPAAVKPYDKSYVGDMDTYTAKYEDTLVNLARDYDLGFVELRAANAHLDPWIPGAGEKIVLPSRHLIPEGPRDGIIINLPEMRLYAFVEKGQPPVTHPLGVGRVGLATPTGTTKVVRKKIGPTWRPTDRMREEDPNLPEAITPGSDNPLGTHAMYLGWPEYAIHGTNRPFGIGRRVSSGCIRLYPEDIVTLFDQVPEGMSVTVVEQPIKAGWIDDKLYIEAHTSLKQADTMEQEGYVGTYEFTRKDLAVILRAAGKYADLIDWETVRGAVRMRHGVPVVIATKPAQTGTADHVDENDEDEKTDGTDPET